MQQSFCCNPPVVLSVVSNYVISITCSVAKDVSSCENAVFFDIFQFVWAFESNWMSSKTWGLIKRTVRGQSGLWSGAGERRKILPHLTPSFEIQTRVITITVKLIRIWALWAFRLCATHWLSTWPRHQSDGQTDEHREECIQIGPWFFFGIKQISIFKG